MPRRPTGSPRPKRRVSVADAAAIDYRNPESLTRYLTDRGRIKARSATGLSRKDQTRMAREVKRARELALLPYATARQGESRDGRRRGQESRDA